jgi:hypothetical protein
MKTRDDLILQGGNDYRTSSVMVRLLCSLDARHWTVAICESTIGKPPRYNLFPTGHLNRLELGPLPPRLAKSIYIYLTS